MKRTVKTSRAIGYIEKMFRTINADSFNNELTEPIITLKDKAHAYGLCSVNDRWSKGDGTAYEISLSTYYLNRPIEELVSTLIHEMTHLYNIEKGIQDCSRGGAYHNTKFRDEAERHMIHIEKDDKYGWTVTSPTEELIDYIIKKGWSEIEINENGAMIILMKGGMEGTNSTNGTTTTGKGNTIRHQCPNCKNIVRATKNLKVLCGDCFEKTGEIVYMI